MYFLPQRLLTPTREQVDAARFEEATHRTTRWIDRCIAAHVYPPVMLLSVTCVRERGDENQRQLKCSPSSREG